MPSSKDKGSLQAAEGKDTTLLSTAYLNMLVSIFTLELRSPCSKNELVDVSDRSNKVWKEVAMIFGRYFSSQLRAPKIDRKVLAELFSDLITNGPNYGGKPWFFDHNHHLHLWMTHAKNNTLEEIPWKVKMTRWYEPAVLVRGLRVLATKYCSVQKFIDTLIHQCAYNKESELAQHLMANLLFNDLLQQFDENQRKVIKGSLSAHEQNTNLNFLDECIDYIDGRIRPLLRESQSVSFFKEGLTSLSSRIKEKKYADVSSIVQAYKNNIPNSCEEARAIVIGYGFPILTAKEIRAAEGSVRDETYLGMD